ncbi:MAG: type I methionyl aminopeptidase [Anaerolineae bacterium]|nr:type I methionyl aminopeptidase [Anaerolineae bacterium]
MIATLNGIDIDLKTSAEIDAMHEAGLVVYEAHMAMRDAVRPGVSTAELDRIAETVIRDHGATPVFKGYPKKDSPDFPASITASINHELVHGIPSPDRILKEGDIISLDCGCTYNGYVGDSAYTWPVGEVAPAVMRLLEVTEGALYEAIRAAVLPNETKDVSLATADYVQRHGYSVAREYTGHGVGKEMHEEPQVPNWWPSGPKARRLNFVSVPLRPGMTIAIEPMVIAGRAELRELSDKWTVVTRDRSLCAHYEHTIAVTEGEPIILTRP